MANRFARTQPAVPPKRQFETLKNRTSYNDIVEFRCVARSSCLNVCLFAFGSDIFEFYGGI